MRKTFIPEGKAVRKNPSTRQETRPTVIFLSPHFDDVALSCGGYARVCAAAGTRVTVVTVCAGTPDNVPLSPFAREQHRRWGNPRDPVAARAAEDRQAARMLGAGAVHLPLPDAIYRRKANGTPLVQSNRSLFGLGYVTETALVDKIARQVRALVTRKRHTTIVAPLGTGKHVDHVLTRDAALRLLALGYRIRWYEELPYAERRGAVARARRAFGGVVWHSETVPITITPKLRAIAAYASQMRSTFDGVTDMRARISAHAARTGLGIAPHAERLWTMLGTDH